MVPGNRIRGNGHKHRKFCLNVGENFTVRVTENWHRLPREFVEFSGDTQTLPGSDPGHPALSDPT